LDLILKDPSFADGIAGDRLLPAGKGVFAPFPGDLDERTGRVLGTKTGLPGPVAAGEPCLRRFYFTRPLVVEGVVGDRVGIVIISAAGYAAAD
jgi:hypothetical protein